LDHGPCSARLLTASSAMRLPDVPPEESGREISDGNDWSKVRGFLARCRRYIAFTCVHEGCGEREHIPSRYRLRSASSKVPVNPLRAAYYLCITADQSAAHSGVADNPD